MKYLDLGACGRRLSIRAVPARACLTRRPAPQSCEAPERAQPGIHPSRDARALGGRNLAARRHGENRGHRVPNICDRPQRRHIDAETCRRGQWQRAAAARIARRAAATDGACGRADPPAPARPAAARQARAPAAWGWECRSAAPSGSPELPFAKRPRARGKNGSGPSCWNSSNPDPENR